MEPSHAARLQQIAFYWYKLSSGPILLLDVPTGRLPELIQYYVVPFPANCDWYTLTNPRSYDS